MDTSALQDGIETIIKHRRNVRDGIARSVAATCELALARADGLAEVVAATMRGAANSVAERSSDPDGTLREVVAGLGDGVAMAAHAAELTIKEAGKNTLAYAREDLDQLAAALDTISVGFVSSVTRGVKQAADRCRGGAESLEQHAAVTLRRIKPSLTAAVDAAREDLPRLPRAILGAGVAATRGGMGALFTALGQKLSAGQSRTRHAPHS